MTNVEKLYESKFEINIIYGNNASGKTTLSRKLANKYWSENKNFYSRFANDFVYQYESKKNNSHYLGLNIGLFPSIHAANAFQDEIKKSQTKKISFEKMRNLIRNAFGKYKGSYEFFGASIIEFSKKNKNLMLLELCQEAILFHSNEDNKELHVFKPFFQDLQTYLNNQFQYMRHYRYLSKLSTIEIDKKNYFEIILEMLNSHLDNNKNSEIKCKKILLVSGEKEKDSDQLGDYRAYWWAKVIVFLYKEIFEIAYDFKMEPLKALDKTIPFKFSENFVNVLNKELSAKSEKLQFCKNIKFKVENDELIVIENEKQNITRDWLSRLSEGEKSLIMWEIFKIFSAIKNENNEKEPWILDDPLTFYDEVNKHSFTADLIEEINKNAPRKVFLFVHEINYLHYLSYFLIDKKKSFYYLNKKGMENDNEEEEQNEDVANLITLTFFEKDNILNYVFSKIENSQNLHGISLLIRKILEKEKDLNWQVKILNKYIYKKKIDSKELFLVVSILIEEFSKERNSQNHENEEIKIEFNDEEKSVLEEIIKILGKIADLKKYYKDNYKNYENLSTEKQNIIKMYKKSTPIINDISHGNDWNINFMQIKSQSKFVKFLHNEYEKTLIS